MSDSAATKPRRLRLVIGAITIRAQLLDTGTAEALWQAAPFEARGQLWGDEVYFSTPVSMPAEKGARSIVEAGELAFWPDGDAIAIGFGPTPISRGKEIRLASPCNIWAQAIDDVRALKTVRAGCAIRVERE